jgi:hypothetical protein
LYTINILQNRTKRGTALKKKKKKPIRRYPKTREITNVDNEGINANEMNSKTYKTSFLQNKTIGGLKIKAGTVEIYHILK